MPKKKIGFIDENEFTYEGRHILVSSVRSYYVDQNHSKIETQEHFRVTPECLNRILNYYRILKGPEQRSSIRKNVWNSKTQEEKDLIISGISKSLNNRSQEELDATRAKRQLTWSAMEEDKFLKYKEKLSNSLEESWESKSQEWLEEWRSHISEGWQGKSEEELFSIAQKKAVAMESKSTEELASRSLKISNAWHSKSEERKQQALNKKSKALKESWENRSEEDIKIAVSKAYNTKKLNGTFNSSAPEEKFYQRLLQFFDEGDVFTQYSKDSRYPFQCDFYIKSLDLFIELNLFFTHGTHPFDSTNEEDLKLLEELSQKASKNKFYENAVKVWTISDPLKIKTAKENNLNYMTFYSNKDIENFFHNLKIN